MTLPNTSGILTDPGFIDVQSMNTKVSETRREEHQRRKLEVEEIRKS